MITAHGLYDAKKKSEEIEQHGFVNEIYSFNMRTIIDCDSLRFFLYHLKIERKKFSFDSNKPERLQLQLLAMIGETLVHFMQGERPSAGWREKERWPNQFRGQRVARGKEERTRHFGI